jgi:hypothetical protein
MNVFESLIVFMGFLSFGTFGKLVLKVNQEMDYIPLLDNMLLKFATIINCFVVTSVVIFSSVKGYIGVIEFVFGFIIIINFISKWLISIVGNNALIPLVINIISLILFVVYLFL